MQIENNKPYHIKGRSLISEKLNALATEFVESDFKLPLTGSDIFRVWSSTPDGLFNLGNILTDWVASSDCNTLLIPAEDALAAKLAGALVLSANTIKYPVVVLEYPRTYGLLYNHVKETNVAILATNKTTLKTCQKPLNKLRVSGVYTVYNCSRDIFDIGLDKYINLVDLTEVDQILNASD